VKIALSWLREFVDLPEAAEELRPVLDDLGLVVEGLERVGEGLEDVVVARVEEIRDITGADRIHLVVVDAGDGPLEIVCGADNFAVGDHVPLAPVGAVLPGGFVIARRQMRGVTSNGMLCSARELGLGDNHEGLLVLDALVTARAGEHLREALSITSDVVFDISVEGNRPDAWSVEGVARDLAIRLGRELRPVGLAEPGSGETSASFAGAGIDDPDLCGRLTVSVLRGVRVRPSPPWVVQRLLNAGMRPISNVVDASNLVMLELGQPTHPYDADRVARHTLRARRARAGESLVTLDGVTRTLATAGRGLGDTGEDCVIVDGDDRVLGLAGIMGGSSSEIGADTTDVLLEAAYFDPMAVARSAKRHGLRSEASHRFERGVDPELALRAAARFVAVLRLSSPELAWLAEPLDVRGRLPAPPVVELRPADLERTLGTAIDASEASRLLQGLNFAVEAGPDGLRVTPPSSRPDVRPGAAGRADVVEEVARLYGYGRLGRRTPSWPEPGGLSGRQRLRRQLRDVLADLGTYEAWTPSLGSDEDFDLLHAGQPRVRVANPLASDEAVLRATMLTGLLRAWARNVERGTGDVVLGEIGTVFTHPDAASEPRLVRGGVEGATTLRLPAEAERCTVVLGREDDDAASAVAMWSIVAERLGLAEVVVRSHDDVAPGLHPTRGARLVDRATGALIGVLGEVDPELVRRLVSLTPQRRVGVVDLDLDALGDPARATRRPQLARVPSRFPSAIVDLAFVTPLEVHAADLAEALRTATPLVEAVTLFDVFHGAGLPEHTRSIAYNVRFASPDRTLRDEEVTEARSALIERASVLGARLR
jgi:phenylalanyl-tRNA synthetase beta chain